MNNQGNTQETLYQVQIRKEASYERRKASIAITEAEEAMADRGRSEHQEMAYMKMRVLQMNSELEI